MDPAAAFQLYRLKVESHAPLTAADDPLFERMRAQDKHANLRIVMGISRWVVERIDALPALAKAAHGLDPLTLLQGANGVVTARLREYRGTSVDEFRRLLDAALTSHFQGVFGH